MTTEGGGRRAAPDGDTSSGGRAGARSGDGYGTLRLVFAFIVVADHTPVLTGIGNSFMPVKSGVDLGAVSVGAFMGLSGYFIMRSWQRDPNLYRFWVRRLLRIMPGLVVVLGLSALVLGPLVTTLGKRAYLAHPATWSYLGDNLLLFPQQYVLPGVFADNPYPSAINGSLWSLPVEFLGYALIAVLGLLITFSRYRFVMVVFALAMAVLLQRMSINQLTLPPVLLMVPIFPLLQYLGMYAAGAAIWLYRDRIRLSWFGVLLCVGIDFTLYSSAMVEVARIFTLPYLVIAIGHLLPRRLWLPGWLTVANYGVYLYGFVVLQTLLFLGLRTPWLVAAAAVPVALVAGLVSWHVVEKQAMKLRHVLIRRRKPAAVPREEPAAGAPPGSEPTEELPAVGSPQPAPATS
ncbi:acyltransferase [Actinophytocola sp.]|jgi:peptidoglycan/LPS O-acetylase OafA/YrhL|uniref:acyltransferase family protein n=1 Tax=Actinophytocola sp. TaxID=1872138 RepID=UPI002EDAD850